MLLQEPIFSKDVFVAQVFCKYGDKTAPGSLMEYLGMHEHSKYEKGLSKHQPPNLCYFLEKGSKN